MSMVRTAIKACIALLLVVVAGFPGERLAAADGPDTPREVEARIEALEWPVLRRGVTRWEVAVVGRLLGVRSDDGVYDDRLAAAVGRYQRDRDLAERDQVGTETWENLRYTFGVAGPGSRGHKVYAVQIALHNNDHPVRLDGLYGNRTRRAVRDFQREVGIDADGVTRRLTFRALVCQGA